LIRKGASQAIQMVATLAFDLIMIAMLNITADYIVKTYQVTSREFSLRSYDGEFMGLPLIVFVAPIAIAILAITLHIILRKTKFGIAIRGKIILNAGKITNLQITKENLNITGCRKFIARVFTKTTFVR
jgi:branched-subunit amino acid ABC-type transport system permease component